MSNLKELIENLTEEKIIDIVENFGSNEYKRTNNAIIFKTICHHISSENASMKLYYYPKTHTFHCYTCCGTFNIIELFKKRYELMDIQYNFYEDIILKLDSGIKRQKAQGTFYQPYKPLYNNKKSEIEVNLAPLNKGILNAFTFYAAPEWIEDGISETVMRRFNIRYSIEDNRIIIPHYDMDGNLIGIRGRTLNDNELYLGKYLPVKINGEMYNHPLGFNLYGLNFVKENIKKYKTAIVAEAEKSVLQYETMFGKDKNIVVATCGSNFCKYQLDLLLKCGAERILIAFDKEGETWAEQEKYFKKLKNLCEKYKNYALMGFIWDNSGLLKLKQSPFDCGADIAAKLISKGVWI